MQRMQKEGSVRPSESSGAAEGLQGAGGACGALWDLEEAVDAAQDSGEDKRRERMMAQMLSFHHVVLDEAGAMLQPDMVGTVIHGCRFLLCVGDHHQVPIRHPLVQK